MKIEQQIKTYIASQPAEKSNDMQALHKMIMQIKPGFKLWFVACMEDKGRIVANPNIGYGSHTIRYAGGGTKEFYQVGISANTTGISVYVMGIEDKKYLAQAYGDKIGKASVSGYCIKFKALKDINIDVLESAIRFGFEASH